MLGNNFLLNLPNIKKAKTSRCSSWDTSGRNADRWLIKAGETKVLADIKGAGSITHIWMTQYGKGVYRNMVLKMYWDGEKNPSVLAPLGDFFCLGNNVVNSFESLPFTASARCNNSLHDGVALNCYLPMPFNKSARIEVTNEGSIDYGQYFYINYEQYEKKLTDDIAYFHAQFRRENPCDGWGHEIEVNTSKANIINKGRLAWDNNYVILDAKGEGHYIGCNLSVSNFQGTWWGEGDDMIWIDGYKWPPDLHGTGSEDYFNQAWGMQDNAYLMNGSSIYEKNTEGYQTSYVFHLTNPVRFRKSIKATIEHGHGNHLSNEMSSVAYWYQKEPHKKFGILPVKKRQPVKRIKGGDWIIDKSIQTPQKKIILNPEMKKMKKAWAKKKK
jgi:hypothetical protein